MRNAQAQDRFAEEFSRVIAAIRITDDAEVIRFEKGEDEVLLYRVDSREFLGDFNTAKELRIDWSVFQVEIFDPGDPQVVVSWSSLLPSGGFQLENVPFPAPDGGYGIRIVPSGRKED